MPYVMIDVEADGPCPGTDMYSMVQLGMVVVERGLTRTFFGRFRPISRHFQPEALQACHLSRAKTLRYPQPMHHMHRLNRWAKSIKQEDQKIICISDNPGYDWAFLNHYCWAFLGHNPFGHSAQDAGCLVKGATGDLQLKWGSLRARNLSHHALGDALDNARLLLQQARRYGWNLRF